MPTAALPPRELSDTGNYCLFSFSMYLVEPWELAQQVTKGVTRAVTAPLPAPSQGEWKGGARLGCWFSPSDFWCSKQKTWENFSHVGRPAGATASVPALEHSQCQLTWVVHFH